MEINHERLNSLRSGRDELENHVIDEFLAGHLTRRDFLRRGAVVGMSLPLLGGIIAACGSTKASNATTAAGGTGSTTKGVPGATIRAGIILPTGVINPLTVADQGGLDMLGQTGEYLCLSDETLTLRPVLAESWKSNSDGTVWTFQIRKGVKFSNGQPLTADDVVYTYKLNSNPASSANALSAFGGVLLPDGVQKVNDYEVAFHLESANGNFPYLCSSDSYNMIILPNNYDPAKWETSFIGTGPFVMKTYTKNVGATFARNESYWGTKALPIATQFTFYADLPPQITALQGGTIDVIGQFSVTGGEALLSNAYNVIKFRSSTHRELSMRCDQAPFSDPRVRQAVALTLNRPDIVQALFKGLSDLGNDSPFAPVFPSTNTSVPQRHQDIAKAKSLMSAAGHSSGFSVTMYSNNTLEMPLYAEIIKQSCQKIGININLQVQNGTEYYGKATFGNSNWLDGTMSLVDYGARGVPNVFLTAPLQSTTPSYTAAAKTGTWNAAHFNNSQYDTLSKQYIAALDLSSQRSIAGRIETLLLAETPVIFGYFYNYLTATAKNVTGAYPTAIGHIFLYNCSKS
jgi:peptide/nickel transport system substrate-binding protein